MSSDSMNSIVNFQFEWTITRVGFLFYKDHPNPSCLQTKPFAPPIHGMEEVEFFLQFFPNSVYNEQDRGQVSLFLKLHSDNEVELECKFSILNFLGKKSWIQKSSGKLTKYSRLGLEKFMERTKIHDISEGFVDSDGNLTILCQIRIFKLFQTMSNGVDNNHAQPNSTSDTTETLADESSAQIEVFKHSSVQIFNKFTTARQKNLIDSGEFVHTQLEAVKFNLRLWPNGSAEQHEGHLSVHLQLIECDERHIEAHTCLAILDQQKQKHNPEWIYRRIEPLHEFQWDRYIECSRLLTKDLLGSNDDLLIHSEVEVVRSINGRSRKRKLNVGNRKPIIARKRRLPDEINFKDLYYPMEPKKGAKYRGRVVVLNNVKYTDPNMHRAGSEKDVARIKEVFGKLLNFKVKVYNDKSYEETKALLNHEAKNKVTANDCCLVVIVLAHGTYDYFLCSDIEEPDKDNRYEYKKLYAHFYGDRDNCPKMNGKPKLFFIQACQGEGTDDLEQLLREKAREESQAAATPPTTNTLAQDGSKTLALAMLENSPRADLLAFYSCYCGEDSRRDIKAGTFFIQDLCDVLQEQWEKHNLNSMLNEVKLRVDKRVSVEIKTRLNLTTEKDEIITAKLVRQIPTVKENTLRKSIKFCSIK